MRPTKYAGLRLPAKLPPNAVELIVKALPIRGFLEQMMGNLLVNGLTELADRRPIYPSLDKCESALKFLALYVRAYNEKRRPPHIKAKLEASYLDFADCAKAAEALLEYKAKGGSSGGGEVPADLERMNEMWDSIKQRDVNDFW